MAVRIALAFLALTVCAVGGCQSLQPTSFSPEFADAAKQVATSMTDQAVYEQLAARLDGQIIEPGYELYFGTLYVAGAKLKGASGQIGLQGTGAAAGPLSEPAREVLLESIQDDDALLELIRDVLRQRTGADQPDD